MQHILMEITTKSHDRLVVIGDQLVACWTAQIDWDDSINCYQNERCANDSSFNLLSPHDALTLKRRINFKKTSQPKGYIQFEIIINVLFSSLRFIWIPVSWVYGH